MTQKGKKPIRMGFLWRRVGDTHITEQHKKAIQKANDFMNKI